MLTLKSAMEQKPIFKFWSEIVQILYPKPFSTTEGQSSIDNILNSSSGNLHADGK